MSNSRTRVISQSKAVYLTPTGWTNGGANSKFSIEADQLQGVDTFSYEIDLAGSRQDVREFGQLARIGTVRMSEINPTLSFGYYLSSGANEKHLGFNESDDNTSQCISAFLNEDVNKKESNIFVGVVDEGDDAIGFTAQQPSDVIGFGNCFLSSYSVNLSVGEIPRADIEMQASNVVFYSDARSGLISPSLNLDGARAEPNPAANIDLPTATVCGDLDGGLKVLKPHDITVAFTTNGITSSADGDGIGGQAFDTSLSALQSVSIDVPLAREVIESIGTQLAYAKPLQFPIDVTMNMSALVTEFAEGALEYALTGTAGDRTTDISVAMNAGGAEQMKFTLKGAVLDSQSFSQGLDDNETVDLTFSAQIGGASTSNQGLFMTKLKADDTVSRSTAAKNAATTTDATQPITHGS